MNTEINIGCPNVEKSVDDAHLFLYPLQKMIHQNHHQKYNRHQIVYTLAQQYAHRYSQTSGSSILTRNFTDDLPPALQRGGHHNLSLCHTQ